MELRDALKELAKRVEEEIIRRLRGDAGINPRTGTNTLAGSQLEESIRVMQISDDELEFQIADYYMYVVTGWRRTKRFPNTVHLFIRNITDWVRRKNVVLGNMTQNEVIWYLYNKMLIEGRTIAPRPFINYDENGDVSKILPFLDDFFDKWADEVFNLITEEVDKRFNG